MSFAHATELSLISKNSRPRFMLQLMLLLCRFWILIRIARSLRSFPVWWWLRQYCFSSWFLLRIGSVRILDTTVSSGSLVWLYSPAWNAAKLTLPGGWIHLSFRGHRPYLFRSDDGSCSRTNAWQFPTYPRRRIHAFLPFGIKAGRVCWSFDVK